MSRSGYSDGDYENWEMICWRGAVASAIRGQRGQRLLRELAEGMDAMPAKQLIANELQSDDGAVCALGVVGVKRRIDLTALAADEDNDGASNGQIAKAFDIAKALAQEIQYVNDDGKWGGPSPEARARGMRETPEERWFRVRTWVTEHLKADRG